MYGCTGAGALDATEGLGCRLRCPGLAAVKGQYQEIRKPFLDRFHTLQGRIPHTRNPSFLLSGFPFKAT